MISLPIYFWIGALILVAIFVIWLIGIMHNGHRTYYFLDVACAGSVNSSYPAKIKVKIPNDPVFSNSKLSGTNTSSLMRFIVKGNSMQYAKILYSTQTLISQ